MLVRGAKERESGLVVRACSAVMLVEGSETSSSSGRIGRPEGVVYGTVRTFSSRRSGRRELLGLSLRLPGMKVAVKSRLRGPSVGIWLLSGVVIL